MHNIYFLCRLVQSVFFLRSDEVTRVNPANENWKGQRGREEVVVHVHYVSSQSLLVLSPRTISREEQAASSVIFMPVSINYVISGKHTRIHAKRSARAPSITQQGGLLWKTGIEEKEMAVFS